MAKTFCQNCQKGTEYKRSEVFSGVSLAIILGPAGLGYFGASWPGLICGLLFLSLPLFLVWLAIFCFFGSPGSVCGVCDTKY